jgi:exodeoxyribonuclease VII large subunit
MMPPAFSTESTSGNPAGSQTAITVTQLNRLAKRLLESHFDFVWIEGELSNLATPASGHWYFSLKDDNAQVRCAMFRNRNQRLRIRPQNGQLVRLRARVSLYEGRGEFQLIVEHMEDAGAGALQRAFEALKLKLQNEGLFDSDRKRPLPAFPGRVAVVSSRSGAALRDVITVFERRFPAIRLSLFPVAVQGHEAAAQIVAALETVYRLDDFDAVLLTRGGGSAEDLSAFNDEALARKIAASPVPVVSAIGHEIDFTIADFVADRRAATPSAAAEMLSPDQRELSERLLNAERNLSRQLRRQVRLLEARLGGLRGRLRHPGERLREQAQRLDELELRLRRGMEVNLRHRQHEFSTQASRLRGCSPDTRLAQLQVSNRLLAERAARALQRALDRYRYALGLLDTRLNAISPTRTLERGYAIVLDDQGRLVQDAARVKPGDITETRLKSGSLSSRVLESRPEAEG